MPVIHRTIFECDVCASQSMNTQRYNCHDLKVLQWNQPSGWRWVGDKIVCPDHDVKITPRDASESAIESYKAVHALSEQWAKERGKS